MTAPYYADDTVSLYLDEDAGCLAILPTLPDASVDAICTDPPYELAFMGRAWDSSGIAYNVDVWRECLRVLKPGGHLLAFGGTRTYHRMACAIEDAGFEIRDSIHWIYGSGFPKGQDIAKSIDKRRDDRADILRVTAWLAEQARAVGWDRPRLNALFGFRPDGMAGHWITQGVAAAVPTPEQWDRLRDALGFDDTAIRPLVARLNGRKGTVGEDWARREVIGTRASATRKSDHLYGDYSGDDRITAPASEAARRWQGWNTALKPAHEPIVLARKSTGFHTTVANVLQHGTGALNIDACRVTPSSRWPSNLLLSHPPLLDDHGQPVGDACVDGCVPGCPAAEMDLQSGVLRSGSRKRGAGLTGAVYGNGRTDWAPERGYTDHGGASRFFPVFRYEAKAPAAERPRLPDGTAHPTVKPLALMRWLVRLVTPPGGLMLDPFAGTGTTLAAARDEGMRAVGIEKDPTGAELARIRLAAPAQPVLDLGEAIA
jgi:hypothetical protein